MLLLLFGGVQPGVVNAATIPSTLQLFPPVVGPTNFIVTSHISTTLSLYSPSIQGGLFQTAFIPSTLQLFPPSIPLAYSRLSLLGMIAVGNEGMSLRRTLQNQEYLQGCWTFSELVTEYGARDIGPNNRHGVYEGANFVQGISVEELPEGGLATQFNSTDQVRIVNLGNGEDPLSLANGGFDLFTYFRTTLVDSNARGLVTMFDNSALNGWFKFIQNGLLFARLFVNGTMVFSISLGFVANGVFNRGHVCYEPELGRVRGFLNGVQTVQQLGTTLEPAFNAADLVIGGWDHVSTTDQRFVGEMHYVMVSREGNPALAAAAEETIQWTDISNDITDLEVQIGDQSITALGSTAPTGRATFKLLNSNPLGRYSYGHVNALPGFGLANPVWLRTFDGATTRPLFRGFISDLNPSTGPNGERMTAVDCVDWMEILAVEPTGEIQTVLNKTSDYCIRRLVGQVNRPPAAVDIELGNEQFPFAFDQLSGTEGKMLQEVSEINHNEGGNIFITRNGTFTFQSRQHRQGLPIPVATLSGEWRELEVGMGLHEIINTLKATVYPREVGSGTGTEITGSVSGGSTKRRQLLVPGQEVPFQGQYSDPEERAASVGAVDIQTMVALTDYTMTANEDGTGEDLSSYVQFVYGNPPKSGGSYSFVVKNTHPNLAGHFHFRIRGRILRRFDPITTSYQDRDSVNQFLTRDPVTLNLRYLDSAEAGYARCKYLVNLFKGQQHRPRTLQAIIGPTLLHSWTMLNIEVGDPIELTEPVSALPSGIYWVQSLHYAFRENMIADYTITLVPSAITGPVFIVGDPELGVVGTAIVGY